jgi:hypothetical protein
MKLNAKVLTKMIQEELTRAGAKRAPKKLAEIQAPEPIDDFSHGGYPVYDALQEIKDDWMELGVDDPSVLGGAAAENMDSTAFWEVQVDAAIEELDSRWAEVYNEVQEKLINGGFFKRPGGM